MADSAQAQATAASGVEACALAIDLLEAAAKPLPVQAGSRYNFKPKSIWGEVAGLIDEIVLAFFS